MAKLHPNKEINAAIEFAVSQGWRYTLASGHAHGILWCPLEARGGCQKSVWSTPKNPFGHAQEIYRKVRQCPHPNEETS